MVRLLGVDPGLRFTGWGVIEVGWQSSPPRRRWRDRHRQRDHRAATPEGAARSLVALIAQYSPDEAAIEETYVNRNGTATLKLGYARGVALLVPALVGVPVTEYAAKTVKLSVVGSGGAEKAQVQMMVRRLLPGA